MRRRCSPSLQLESTQRSTAPHCTALHCTAPTASAPPSYTRTLTSMPFHVRHKRHKVSRGLSVTLTTTMRAVGPSRASPCADGVRDGMLSQTAPAPAPPSSPSLIASDPHHPKGEHHCIRAPLLQIPSFPSGLADCGHTTPHHTTPRHATPCHALPRLAWPCHPHNQVVYLVTWGMNPRTWSLR